MKSIIALLFGLGSCWKFEYAVEDLKNMDTLDAFQSWANDFDREYEGLEEESYRYLVWLDNLYIIAAYNTEDLGFKLKLNQFADMTKDEFLHYVHGDNGACFKKSEPDYILNSFGRDNHFIDEVRGAIRSNPDTVDWTTKGVVTPVKNQGQCGSCWSFSATGAIECNYAIKTGELNSLSEQELMDCAGIRYGCEGCNGGEMSGAMKYAATQEGLCSEEEYPYTAKDGTCDKSKCTKLYDASKGVEAVTVKSSSALEDATAKGCVSIGIEADQSAFQFYSSGVLTGKCGTSIDHGVLVVGYGTEGTNKYWKVKNSWGTSWGEDGYVKICRDCNANDGSGECGILLQPNVPTFA